MFTVYRATSPSGKVYIGITSRTLARRKTQHISAANAGSDYAFHRAIRKYGEQIKWETLHLVDSFDQASNLEKSLISEYGSFGENGYNLTSGGEGVIGLTFKMSDETIAKISANNGRFWLGKTRSEETRRKCSEAQKGKPRGPISEEHRAKLRAAALARYAQRTA